MTLAAHRATRGQEQADGSGTASPNIYYDPVHRIKAVKLLPGEYFATSAEVMLVTVLGSCVAACIRDPVLGVGGMNHFMLPEAGASGGDPAGAPARYGTYAMEVLINEIVKLGGRRTHLEAKVFGGGNVMSSLTHSNVGTKNAHFVLQFLATESIPVVGKDLEDTCPRKVYFMPGTGKVRLKKLRSMHNSTILDREKSYRSTIEGSSVGGSVDLF